MKPKENNYLTPSVIQLFKRVEYYKGYINHIEHDVKKYSQNLIEKLQTSNLFPEKTEIQIKGSRLVISDLTGETDQGWEINYPLPTEGYKVSNIDYLEKNEQLIQVFSSTLFVQSYEALETYFKDILTLYFKKNIQLAYETIGKINCVKEKDSINWEKTVRKIKQGTNNSELLNIFRTISPEFITSELKNNKGIDLSSWYKVISIARHSITHSNSIIKNDLYNQMNKVEHDILSNFFEVQKDDEGRRMIVLSAKQGSELLELICEYGFLIFKCMSIENDLDWKILKYMNKHGA